MAGMKKNISGMLGMMAFASMGLGENTFMIKNTNISEYNYESNYGSRPSKSNFTPKAKIKKKRRRMVKKSRITNRKRRKR